MLCEEGFRLCFIYTPTTPRAAGFSRRGSAQAKALRPSFLTVQAPPRACPASLLPRLPMPYDIVPTLNVPPGFQGRFSDTSRSYESEMLPPITETRVGQPRCSPSLFESRPAYNVCSGRRSDFARTRFPYGFAVCRRYVNHVLASSYAAFVPIVALSKPDFRRFFLAKCLEFGQARSNRRIGRGLNSRFVTHLRTQRSGLSVSLRRRGNEVVVRRNRGGIGASRFIEDWVVFHFIQSKT